MNEKAARTGADDVANGMRLISEGIFTMGSTAFYPEEQPTRRVKVDSFWIDEAPVTNAQFAEFVEATGFVTFAEIPPDPKDYPGLDPAMAKAGSLVFTGAENPVAMHDWSQWWSFVHGADWRHPLGPGSNIDDLMDHPVVHVAHRDAQAFADWADKRLPSEAEHEYAARGGHEGREFIWGDELAPGGAMLANYWQGRFPYENTVQDGWLRTSPVRHFPPNDYGLYDMAGNVWEWTDDWYSEPKPVNKRHAGACCVIENPRGATRAASFDPCSPGLKIPRKVIKGGSHLCADNYCQRYRPAARQGEAIDSTTSHIGFRCVRSA